MRIIISTLAGVWLFSSFACTSYKIVPKKNETPGAQREEIQSGTPDSSRIEVPRWYQKRFEKQHGLVLGGLGSLAGFYFMLNQNLQAETLNYQSVFLGAGIGFIGGYFIGKYSGRSFAKKKYKRDQAK